METTFDKFITNDPIERELFYKEYNDFILSEFYLEKMEKERTSVRERTKRAGVSHVVMQ